MAERKKRNGPAYWIDAVGDFNFNGKFKYYCSDCSHHVSLDPTDFEAMNQFYGWKYCPNCGTPISGFGDRFRTE